VGKASLLKTIDKFILPFVLFVAARYFGVFVSTFISPIQFEFGLKSDLISIPFVRFIELHDLFVANSVSWLFTASVLGFVFSFIAFRSLHLNDSWLHPKEAARFHRAKMGHLIISGEDALHQVISWSVVTLLALNLAIADFWLGSLSTIVFGMIVSVSSLLTVLYILSLVRDTDLDRKKV
jgi:hypothetical protein